MPWHILAPSAVACDSLHLRASAHLRHTVPFCLQEVPSEFPVKQTKNRRSGYSRNGSSLFSLLFELEFNYVNSAKLLAVLRILLCVESNLLALFKSLEAVAYDCGEVYEYVVAAVVVGDESVAFLRIEPLNCTVVHFGTSIKN